MSAADPEELLKRTRQGDEDAWERLLDEVVPYLHVMAQRELSGAIRTRVDPSDVVQQTCLEAHRDLAGFRGTATPELLAWLRRILSHNVANFIAEHVVAQKRSVRREQPRGSVDPDDPETTRIVIASSASSPSQRAMRGEDALRLARALDKLPPDQRDAVRLRHLEGWTLAQMAEWFGRSEVAVASLLKRGLQSLRNHLPGPGSAA